MATSQHEGHANQLDLLIRAGNVSLQVHDLDTGAKVKARDMLFYLDRRASVRLVRRSNGGQSGSDHLGSTMHGVATRVIKPVLRGDKLKTGFPVQAGGQLSAQILFCMLDQIFLIEVGSGITVYLALHNQEV